MSAKGGAELEQGQLQVPLAGLLGAFRLASAALPIGAFAYSQGLEQAVASALVSDRDSTSAWVLGLLKDSVLAWDVPLLGRLVEAFRESELQRVRQLSAYLLASRSTRELREEERQLGAAMFRILARLGCPWAHEFHKDPRATLACAFALAAQFWNIPRAVVSASYCFAWIEAQVGAATRLVPLGQSDAQHVLTLALQAVDGELEAADLRPLDTLASSAFGQAFLSSAHETQYSRLFRS